MIVLILQGMYNTKYTNEIEFEEHTYSPDSNMITFRVTGITIVLLLCHSFLSWNLWGKLHDW